jgi:hypothetical protein
MFLGLKLGLNEVLESREVMHVESLLERIENQDRLLV